jgi:hypothetical protein
VAPDRVERGSGRTSEISSEVVRFSSLERVAPETTEIELSVHWPVALKDGTKLQLVLKGKPILAGDVFRGMRITKYEFRTRATKREAERVGTARESVRAFRSAMAAKQLAAAP